MATKIMFNVHAPIVALEAEHLSGFLSYFPPEELRQISIQSVEVEVPEPETGPWTDEDVVEV